MHSHFHPFHTQTHHHHHHSSHKKKKSASSESSTEHHRGQDLPSKNASISDIVLQQFKFDLAYYVVLNHGNKKSWENFKSSFIHNINLDMPIKLRYLSEMIESDEYGYHFSRMNELLISLVRCTNDYDELFNVLIPFFMSYPHRNHIEDDFAKVIESRFFEKMRSKTFRELLNLTFGKEPFWHTLARATCGLTNYSDHQYSAKFFNKIHSLLKKEDQADIQIAKECIVHYYNKRDSKEDRELTTKAVFEILKTFIKIGEDPKEILGMSKVIFNPKKGHMWLPFSDFLNTLVEEGYGKDQIFEKEDVRSFVKEHLSALVARYKYHRDHGSYYGNGFEGPGYKEWGFIYSLGKCDLLPDDFFKIYDKIAEGLFAHIKELPEDERNKTLLAIKDHNDIQINRFFWSKATPGLFGKKAGLDKRWAAEIDLWQARQNRVGPN